MRSLLAAVVLCVAAASWGQEGPGLAPAPAPAPAEPMPTRGPLVLRLGVTFDVSRSFNLGGALSGGVATMGLDAGLGYLVTRRLTVDLELAGALSFTGPPTASFEARPGAHFSPIPQLELRFGVPLPLAPTFGVGRLAGAAFVQPLCHRIDLIVGVDYSYFLTDAKRLRSPYGRIEAQALVRSRF